MEPGAAVGKRSQGGEDQVAQAAGGIGKGLGKRSQGGEDQVAQAAGGIGKGRGRPGDNMTARSSPRPLRHPVICGSRRLGYSPGDMIRVAFVVTALIAAAMVAMLTGSIAHDELGVPLDVIRVGALKASAILTAAVTGLLLSRWKG
jgi:hypothetical protein